MQEEALNVLREIVRHDEEGAKALFERIDPRRDVGKQLEELKDEFQNNELTQTSKQLREGFQKWAEANREQMLDWLANLDVVADPEAGDLFDAAIEALATNISTWEDSLFGVFEGILNRAESEGDREAAQQIASSIHEVDWLISDDGDTKGIGPKARAVAQFLAPWLDSPSAAVRQETADIIGLDLDAESPFLPNLVEKARHDPDKSVRREARRSLRCAELLPDDLQPSVLSRVLSKLPIIGLFIEQ